MGAALKKERPALDCKKKANPNIPIEFINKSAKKIEFWKIEESNKKANVFQLRPGQSFEEIFSISHPWLLTDTTSGAVFAAYDPYTRNHSKKVILEIQKGLKVTETITTSEFDVHPLPFNPHIERDDWLIIREEDQQEIELLQAEFNFDGFNQPKLSKPDLNSYKKLGQFKDKSVRWSGTDIDGKTSHHFEIDSM